MYRKFPDFTPSQWLVIAVDAAGWAALAFFAWHYFVTCAC
jgi:hypothetical protein